MKNIDFLKELNVEKMIRFKENSWNGKDYINLENFLTENIDVINYRLDGLTDLLENRKLYEAMLEIVPQIDGLRDIRSLSSAARDELDDLYSVRDLQIYLNLVDYLYDKLNKFTLNSQLFVNIRDEINSICTSEEYEKIKKSLPDNVELIQSLKSITVGVNVDLALHPVEAGIVCVNDSNYVSGNIIDKLLRADINTDSFVCAAPLSVTAGVMSKDERDRYE